MKQVNDNRTRLVLLGTGTPNAEVNRMGSALAVIINSRAYLVDFGPGVVRRAAAAFEMGIAALHVTELDIAFLTHLHSDHTAGYADLMLTPWVLGRENPLQVYGPHGVEEMTRHLHAAYTHDMNMRVCGLEAANPDAYGTVAHEISAGICYQDENVEVQAFKVNHGEGWDAFGFQFTSADRRIVISGDTAPIESVIDLWRGCDVLVHEVYSAAGYATRPTKWQRYHAHMHTSSLQLAEIANQVKPGLLVLTHMLFWGTTEQQLLDEISSIYPGEVVCGHDLDFF